MNDGSHVEAFAALGHPGRLAVFRLLARRAPGGVRPSQIAAALAMKPNTASVHLSAITRAGLVRTWREGRSVYYGVALDGVGALVDYLVGDCCRGRPELCAPLIPAASPGRSIADRPLNVLFLCTGNAARSIFAENLLNAHGEGRFVAHSAGTRPRTAVNRFTAHVLAAAGYRVPPPPKSVARFAEPVGPRMDVVLTVCDAAANDDGPPLPGRPMTAHWGVPDPSAATDGDELAAFQAAFDVLRHRVLRLVALPFASLDALGLQRQLDAIGRETPGAAPKHNRVTR